MIAALYVEKNGAYFGLPDVDPWDEERDARLYEGPWPVVAHPPCARWCQVAHLVEKRYGYRVGDDGGTFAAALAAVRRFGGVLEHPAFSQAWKTYGLPRPGRQGWTRSFFDEGYVTEVDQHAYGFPGRKRTWLYVHGCELPALDWALAPADLPVVSRWGWNRPGPHFRDEHHTIRPDKSSATPLGFRNALLGIARTALPSFEILPRSALCLLNYTYGNARKPLIADRIAAAAVSGASNASLHDPTAFLASRLRPKHDRT